MNKGILGRQSFELVGRSSEIVTSLLLQGSRNLLSKASVSVETSADGGASLSDLVHILQALLNAQLAIFQLVHITREFLAQGERRCILSVSSTNLHDVVEFGALSIKGCSQCR